MFLFKKGPYRLLLLPKLKSDSGSGSGFSQIFDSGSERKAKNPARVDSDFLNPLPLLKDSVYFTINILLATDRLELLCRQSNIRSRCLTQFEYKVSFSCNWRAAHSRLYWLCFKSGEAYATWL